MVMHPELLRTARPVSAADLVGTRVASRDEYLESVARAGGYTALLEVGLSPFGMWKKSHNTSDGWDVVARAAPAHGVLKV